MFNRDAMILIIDNSVPVQRKMQKVMQFSKLSGHNAWPFTHITDRLITSNEEMSKIPQT